MTTMRRHLSVLLAAAAAFLASACSDVPVMPRSATNAPSSPSADRSHDRDANSAKVLISVNGGIIPVVIPSVGDIPVFTLLVPRGAVSQDIVVTATVKTVGGRLQVNFAPDVTFDPSKTVIISTSQERDAVFALERAKVPLTDPKWRTLAIYTVEGGVLTDDGQVTHIDLNTGLVWRRALHFSGYNITAGVACDPSLGDPNCIDTGSVDFGF